MLHKKKFILIINNNFEFLIENMSVFDRKLE